MRTKTRILNIIRACFRVSVIEQLLRKLSTGKDPRSIIPRLVPNNYQYPVGSIRTFDYKGVTLTLDIHDFVSHYLYFGFKDISHEKLMSLVKPGYTVLDVGTNYGTTILQFANLITKTGRAYGFEPDPVNFATCEDNLAQNDASNVSVENIGLGRERGEVSLVVNTESNRGGNRIGIPSTGQEWHKVKIWRLDEWADKNGIKKVDLVKIDVEGYEMEVLAGATQLLKRFAPVLFIELDNNNLGQQGSSAKELLEFLEDHRYSITHAETGTLVSSDDQLSECHFDIVCIAEHSK